MLTRQQYLAGEGTRSERIDYEVSRLDDILRAELRREQQATARLDRRQRIVEWLVLIGGGLVYGAFLVGAVVGVALWLAR